MIPRFDGYAEKIRDSFSRQGMMTTIGARIDSVEPGCVTLSAPVTPAFSQQQGFGHAGLTFALGDTAAGYAALSLCDRDQEVLTSEMKIHLLAPAAGERLSATGRVLKAGRRLIVVRAEVTADGRQVAECLGTIIPVAVRPIGDSPREPR